MEGVTLLPGSSYSRDISEMSPDEVQDAIKNILESYDPDGATTANYGDDFQQTYSYEHMLFTLGIDARYGIGSMEADLSIDTEKETNYVFYKFQQKFYDVVYTAPESSTSVFRDGEGFAEPGPTVPANWGGQSTFVCTQSQLRPDCLFCGLSHNTAQLTSKPPCRRP